jgi:peptidoglycan/LPS O-acetylase OafA/YrhL
VNFREDINGLRAIAVLTVVLFHFGVPGFQGGFVGVDVFFVISGYLMTGIIFTKIDKGSFHIIGFYLERGKRIIPALAALCVCLAIFGWLFILPNDFETIGKHIAASISFVSNFSYWSEAGYFDAASHEKWLLHTWSLSVEWQFYILYPIVIVLVNTFIKKVDIKILLALGAIISFLLSIWFSARDPNAVFYLLPTRAWEMLAGGLVFLYPISLPNSTKKIVEVSGLTLILFGVFWLDPSDTWPGFLAFIPVLGTVLVILAAHDNSIFTNNWMSTWLGKTSYSVYLWHWPIVVGLNYYELLPNSIWLVTGVICSFLMGYLSFIFIEMKTKDIGKNTLELFHIRLGEYGTRTLSLASIGLVVALLGAMIHYKHGFTGRFSDDIILADAESSNRNPHKCLSSPKSDFDHPGCVLGNKDNIKAILIGDSHANAMTTAILNAFTDSKKEGLLVLTRHSCPAILGAKSRNYAVYNCTAANTHNLDIIKTKYVGIPVFVINRASGYLYGQSNVRRSGKSPSIYFNHEHLEINDVLLAEFSQQYQKTMCMLSKDNPVFVTAPVPEMRLNVPRRMARRAALNDELKDITLDKKRYLERNEFITMLNSETEKNCNVKILDTTKYLCNEKLCFGSLNGRPLYFDGDHLSEFGNKLLVPMFKGALSETLH